MAIEHERLRALLSDLAYDAQDRDAILETAARAPGLAGAMDRARRPSELAGAIGTAGTELVALAGGLGAQASARRWFDELRQVAIAIDGSDMIEAGVAPGPAVGAGLRAARAALLDGEAPTRERQLAVAVQAARDTR